MRIAESREFQRETNRNEKRHQRKNARPYFLHSIFAVVRHGAHTHTHVGAYRSRNHGCRLCPYTRKSNAHIVGGAAAAAAARAESPYGSKSNRKNGENTHSHKHIANAKNFLVHSIFWVIHSFARTVFVIFRRFSLFQLTNTAPNNTIYEQWKMFIFCFPQNALSKCRSRKKVFASLRSHLLFLFSFSIVFNSQYSCFFPLQVSILSTGNSTDLFGTGKCPTMRCHKKENSIHRALQSKISYRGNTVLHRSALIENCECRALRKINKILLEHRIADGYRECVSVSACYGVLCLCCVRHACVSEHFLDFRVRWLSANTARSAIDDDNNHVICRNGKSIKAFLLHVGERQQQYHLHHQRKDRSKRAGCCCEIRVLQPHSMVDNNMTEASHGNCACAPNCVIKTRRHTYTRSHRTPRDNGG